MSRGQLTYYFPTKESLLLAVFDRMLRRLIDRAMRSDGPRPMTGRAWECVRHGLAKHLDAGWPSAAERDFFSLVYTFLAQMGHREDYRDKLSERYREWREVIAADGAGGVPGPRPVEPRGAAGPTPARVPGPGMAMGA